MAEVRPTIEVMWSCPTCVLEKQKLLVPARDLEDVVEWTLQTVERCGKEHKRLSPTCRARTIDLYVPMNNRNIVGGPITQ